MLINVQFLRFAAAMLVVFYHASAHVRATGLPQGSFFAVGEAIGYAGVDIFFVISGFIMAWTTGESAGPAEAFRFLRRRLARIYSGYWPFFLLALAIFAWANPEYLARSSIWRSAVLWPANVLLIAVAWTLIFELYFYCCYTLLIAFARQGQTTVLWASLGVLTAWVLYSQFSRQAYAPGHLETISLAEYYMASPYMAQFIGGSLLAGRLRGRPDGPGLSWLLLGVALFLAGGWLNNAYFAGQLEQGYTVFYRVLIFGVPAVMIVLGLVRLENRQHTAPLRFSLLAGGASYAIYLCHTLLLTATHHLGLNRWLGVYTPFIVQLAFVLLAGVILAYSIVHYRLIERPLHHLFLRWLGVGRRAAKP